MRAALAALLLAATPVRGELAARFVEGAPTDRFEVANEGACALEAVDLVIDLAPSAGGLILDVTASGAGVEVFQPLRVVEGRERLRETPRGADGDVALVLRVGALPPGGRIALTLDLDDTLAGRRITVSGAEIEGALLRLTRDGEVLGQARFDDRGRASVPFDC